jgi:hypothetical protein
MITPGETILVAAEAESTLDLVTAGDMVRIWLFGSKNRVTYMEPVAPPWPWLSLARWVLSKASWPTPLLSSVFKPRVVRSVVSVAVSLTLSWVDLVESGVSSSLASVERVVSHNALTS